MKHSSDIIQMVWLFRLAKNYHDTACCTNRYHFKLHWKTHEGEKCFKCDECDYAACSQRHLESHILTHSGEKPFECDECDHAFRQKQLLTRHKNHHHTADYQPPTPRDKSHDCTACDKSYANKGNLMRHMAQHGVDLSEDDTTSAASGEGEWMCGTEFVLCLRGMFSAGEYMYYI